MDIKDFLPRLRRLIQGPLQTLMVDSLVDSTISFCKKSQILRETLDAGDVKEGDKLTIASTDATLKPWGVVCVYGDDGTLSLQSDYKQTSRGEIEFLSENKNVKVLAYFYPTDKANLPDKLDEHEKSICSGAASELYMMPERSWTNPQYSQYYSQAFTTGYREAWRDVEEEFNNFQNPQVKTDYWM